MLKVLSAIALLACATSLEARTPVWICDNMDVCPDGTTSFTGGGTDNPKGKFDYQISLLVDGIIGTNDYDRQRHDSIIGTNFTGTDGIIGGGK